MAQSQFVKQEVNDFVIEYVLMHCARMERVFQAARLHLRPEQLSEPGETPHRYIWAAMLSYYDDHQELPSFNALSVRVLGSITATPGIAPEVLTAANELMVWMYDKVCNPDTELSSKDALVALRWILLDRAPGQDLRQVVAGAGSKSIPNLPQVLEKLQRQVDQINTIGVAEEDDTTLPTSWVTVGREKRPTGVGFIDKLMDGGSEPGDCNIILGPTGGGKCFGKGTPILLHSGEVRAVEDIVEGDMLMGPDSKPRKVIGVTQGIGPLYKVTPCKGAPYIVNDEHILALVMTDTDKFVDISVREYLTKSKWFKHRAKGYSAGVEFPQRETTLEPYFVGLWLGDGSKDCQRITNADFEVIEYLRRYANRRKMRLSVTHKRNNAAQTYSIVGHEQGIGMNPLTRGLKAMLNNKHIPAEYKINSRKVRLELLAGLCDSDGWLHRPGNFQIMQKNRQLAEDIAFVARSLGFAAYLTQVKKTCCNNGVTGTYNCISIIGDLEQIPTRIARKISPKRAQKKHPCRNGITVTSIGRGKYFGFEVAGADKHFLLGDFTVVHNSTTLNQISCSMAKLEYKAGCEGRESGLVVVVGYEDSKRMMQIRAASCGAHVPKNKLRELKSYDELTTTGRLDQYELDMYRGLGQQRDLLGEQERLEQARVWLDKNLYLLDFHDPKNGGRGHITEIRQKLLAIQDKRKMPIRAVMIDWAGEMIRNYLIATGRPYDGGTMALELAGLLHKAKSEIAVPFDCTVWVAHQLRGASCKQPPSYIPHHSEAQWCTSFADNAWFAFCLGTKDTEHNVCQLVASKTRHGESSPPVICKIDGGFCRMVDVSTVFEVDPHTKRFALSSERSRVKSGPVRGGFGNNVDMS